MITLQISDLKAVQKRFQSIRQKNILPILNFVKIESKDGVATITKDNLDVLIIQKLPSTGDGSLLIHEATLWNFVSFSSSGVVKITTKGDEYILDANGTKIKNQLEPVENYPIQRALPDEGEEIDISELGSLASIIMEEEIPTPRSFIFAGDGKASASDGYVGYSIDYTGPKISIAKSAANLLPKETFTYASIENYDFFLSEKVVFGFIKSEIPFTNIASFFKLPDDLGFEISKIDLLKFNDLALSSSKGKATIVKWSGKELSMHDDITNNTVTGPISAEAEFTYNADQMNKLLKSIPYDGITLIPGENKHFISSPDGGIGLIMHAAKQ